MAIIPAAKAINEPAICLATPFSEETTPTVVLAAGVELGATLGGLVVDTDECSSALEDTDGVTVDVPIELGTEVD